MSSSDVNTRIFVYCNNAAVMLPIGEGLIWSNDVHFLQSDNSIPGCILFYWREEITTTTPTTLTSLLMYAPASAYPISVQENATQPGYLVMDCSVVPNNAILVNVPETPVSTWYALNSNTAVAVTEVPAQPPVNAVTTMKSGYYISLSNTVTVTNATTSGYYFLQVSYNWIKCNEEIYQQTSNVFADSCGCMIRLTIECQDDTSIITPTSWSQYFPRIYSTINAIFLVYTTTMITQLTINVSHWFTCPGRDDSTIITRRRLRSTMTDPDAGIAPTMYLNNGILVPPYGNCIRCNPDLQGYTNGVLVNLYKWPIIIA